MITIWLYTEYQYKLIQVFYGNGNTMNHRRSTLLSKVNSTMYLYTRNSPYFIVFQVFSVGSLRTSRLQYLWHNWFFNLTFPEVDLTLRCNRSKPSPFQWRNFTFVGPHTNIILIGQILKSITGSTFIWSRTNHRNHTTFIETWTTKF